MDSISMWRATANRNVKRNQLEGSKHCDVVIIGAGYTGLSTAYHLQQKGYKTMILEKDQVGSGASGKNGGELISGFPGATMESIANKKGFETAKAMWDISLGSIDVTEKIIQENRIDCDYTRNGDLRPAYKPSHLEAFKKDQEYMAKHLHYDQIQIIEENDMQAEMNTDFYHGARLNLSGAHYHPLNYALGLAEAIENMGAIIYEQSEALTIHHPSKEKVSITTEKGEITAEQLVVTTNAYSGKLHKTIQKSIVPVDSIMISTEPLSEEMVNDLIKKDRAVSDSKNLLYYFRRTGDNRLAFGGSGRASTERGHLRMFDKLHEGMLEVFPQLKDVSIPYRWGGKVGFTKDMLPYMGQLEDRTHFAFGYGGRGASLATYLGSMIADNVMNEGKKDNPLYKEKLRPIPFHSQHAKAVGMLKYYKKLQDNMA